MLKKYVFSLIVFLVANSYAIADDKVNAMASGSQTSSEPPVDKKKNELFAVGLKTPEPHILEKALPGRDIASEKVTKAQQAVQEFLTKKAK